jgi:hypothetical protein
VDTKVDLDASGGGLGRTGFEQERREEKSGHRAKELVHSCGHITSG